ncbi:MAG: MASE4 domain-containing protein [Caulobacteraceae bacterium]|nr:MASE4 domain-containing protein [Caulobacteraceae bacterium]
MAVAVVGGLLLILLVVLPASNLPLGEVSAFIPTVCAMMLVGELLIAALLYAQAAVFRSLALTILASGYVLTALFLIPFALTFPGAFSRGGLLGAGANTTAWLMAFRRGADPLSVILYVWLKQTDRAPRKAQRPAPALLCISSAAALALALTLFATVGHDLLPPIFANRSDAIYAHLFVFNILNIALVAIALGMLLSRRASVLDTWLGVSLAAALIQSLLNLPLHGRFSLGWYALFLVMLLSHLVVLLALIAEANRLYVRLALSTEARRRERSAQLISIDGVAAAISHEIGQPLAAVSLSANAALNSLAHPRPDPERAIKSIRDTLDATRRAFAVARSVRATFSKRAESVSKFDINDLVRDSASLLEREMAAERVSLRLALTQPLPPILANRIQIQQVFVNLLLNAIESLAATDGRARRIVIRSVTPDRQTVQVEISDSGLGIAPERATQIFEPFFTTKPSGTGLGLSLSRNFVEAHGGRLWASQAEDGGAIFHVELPSS